MTTVSTVGQLAARIQRLVNGSRRGLVTYLDEALDATETDVTVEDTPTQMGVTVGSHVAIGEEILYVRAVNDGTKTLTVRRGFMGTPATTHVDGAEVEVDWRFFTVDVIDALADEVRSWPDELFVVEQADVAVGSGDTAVALNVSGFRFPLKIERSRSGADRWLDVTRDYQVRTGLPTTSFSGGTALFLPSSGLGVGTVRVTYAADFPVDVIVASMPIDDIGISTHLIDAAMYGAASRLLTEREAQRSSVESQPESRSSTDVRPLQTLQTGLAYRQLADRRIADEAVRLRARYPFRMTG